MDEDFCLRRFGLRPSGSDIVRIREFLVKHSTLERESQGTGDTTLMKLLCFQLFNHGSVEDSRLIWNAKHSSWDSSCSIDLEFALGGGVSETLAFLKASSCENSMDAFHEISQFVSAGQIDSTALAEFAKAQFFYYS